MITMAFVDYLSAKSQTDDNYLLAQFFCDNTIDRRNTILDVLESLLRQLVLYVESQEFFLIADFLKNYESKGNAMFSSVEAIWDYMKGVPAYVPAHTVCFVVDALDECDAVCLDLFLRLIRMDSQFLGHQPRVFWFLVSRNEPAIRDHLDSSPTTISIDLEDHSRSLYNDYINVRVDELAKLKCYSDDLKAMVQKHFDRKRKGRFFGVSLAVLKLRKLSIRPADTKNIVRKLPFGLSNLYDRIYDKVISHEVERPQQS
jgi:ankyrin repeat domain-containing protein 50